MSRRSRALLKLHNDRFQYDHVLSTSECCEFDLDDHYHSVTCSGFSLFISNPDAEGFTTHHRYFQASSVLIYSNHYLYNDRNLPPFEFSLYSIIIMLVCFMTFFKIWFINVIIEYLHAYGFYIFMDHCTYVSCFQSPNLI